MKQKEIEKWKTSSDEGDCLLSSTHCANKKSTIPALVSTESKEYTQAAKGRGQPSLAWNARTGALMKPFHPFNFLFPSRLASSSELAKIAAGCIKVIKLWRLRKWADPLRFNSSAGLEGEGRRRMLRVTFLLTKTNTNANTKKYKDKYKGKYKDKDRGREQMLRVTASQVLVFLLTIYAYLSKRFQPESQDIPTRMKIMLFKI